MACYATRTHHRAADRCSTSTHWHGWRSTSSTAGRSSDELEAISGLDRFTLARQFRLRFGTSPHRYLTMRRVAAGRRLLASGQAIADVAAETGFADQSHFHRHFLKTFGMTPGRWQRLAAAAKMP